LKHGVEAKSIQLKKHYDPFCSIAMPLRYSVNYNYPLYPPGDLESAKNVNLSKIQRE